MTENPKPDHGERESDLEWLRREIQAGVDSGPGIPVNQALIDEIKASGRERLRNRSKPG